MALDALNGCACNQDAEKDGCYQCLYQYRLGRAMERVSREQAKAVLSELVNSLDKLEKVSTLSEIFINPNLDSVLESRFIESLRRLGAPQAAKDAGLPATRLVQDIVNGKSGWVLEVADQRYRVEPQVNVGPSDGVAVHSKPDFVIWPWPAEPAKRPIAVFCDGWAHHKDILRDDARKRSALVTSTRPSSSTTAPHTASRTRLSSGSSSGSSSTARPITRASAPPRVASMAFSGSTPFWVGA